MRSPDSQRSTFIYHYVRWRMREMGEWLRQADLDDPSLTPANRGHLLMDTALAVYEDGDVDHALDLSGKSLRGFRSAGDRPGLVSGLIVNSYAQLAGGDLVAAARHAEQAWRQARSWPDDPWRQAQAGVIDAVVTMVRGDLAASRRRLDEVLPVARNSDHWPLIGVTLQTIGYAALLAGEVDAAVPSLIEGAEWYRRAGFREGVAYCQESLAAVAARRDRARLSVRCLASASAALERLGIQAYRHPQPMIRALQSDLRTALGDEGFDAAWEEGRIVDLYAMLDEAEHALAVTDPQRLADAAIVSRQEETGTS